MKAPTYTFLMGEYVGRLEALLTYDKIPPEVKKEMQQRAQDLKALQLNDSEINRLINDLHHTKLFQNPIPGITECNDALLKQNDCNERTRNEGCR